MDLKSKSVSELRELAEKGRARLASTQILIKKLIENEDSIIGEIETIDKEIQNRALYKGTELGFVTDGKKRRNNPKRDGVHKRPG